MKKIALFGALILASILVAGCLYLPERDLSLHFTETQLQDKLNAKLPAPKTYLTIFNITLENAKVHLRNGSNKISIGLDVVLNLKGQGAYPPLVGKIEVSAGVAYVPETAQFFLVEPIMDSLSMQGIPKIYAEKVTSALSKALAAYYAEHPVYQLKSTDYKQAAARFVLKSVDVENQELVLKLGM
jgi:hypothetical protein